MFREACKSRRDRTRSRSAHTQVRRASPPPHCLAPRAPPGCAPRLLSARVRVCRSPVMGVVDEMHPTWQHSSAGKLAMQEFPYQRMHRDPVPPPRPLDMSDQFETSYRRQFKQAVPQPARAVPQFSLGRKNALGTSSTYQKMTMDEFKVSKLGLGDSARSWSTNFGDAFSAPTSLTRARASTPRAAGWRHGCPSRKWSVALARSIRRARCPARRGSSTA